MTGTVPNPAAGRPLAAGSTANTPAIEDRS